ncbi:DnaJ domain-containing protein [Mycoplasma tullyi]|uniref:DnaJ domain-containing protein n=1 Tax=Mycoplasma tullyi TaxID=1612150 RepID=A0A7D7Y774_9MOLU|nr:DnaJ domain-containing protein [Mycoplasma tullyi]QMT98756.1 DnaJ domain-containing protein [Mycoplasma tullyi]
MGDKQQTSQLDVIAYFDDYQFDQNEQRDAFKLKTIELDKFYRNLVKDISLSQTSSVFQQEQEQSSSAHYQSSSYKISPEQEKAYYEKQSEAFYDHLNSDNYYNKNTTSFLFDDSLYNSQYQQPKINKTHVNRFSDGRERLFSDSVVDSQTAEKTAEFQIENFIDWVAKKKEKWKKAREAKKKQKEFKKRKLDEEHAWYEKVMNEGATQAFRESFGFDFNKIDWDNVDFGGSSNQTEIDDAYKILGLSKYDSNDDIRSAYRKLAKKYHPDLNKDPGAEEMFKKINHAYEILNEYVL